MADEDEQSATYPLMDAPSLEIAPGREYFGFTCPSCERPFAFMEVPESGQVAFSGDGFLNLRCPHCGLPHLYGMAQVERFAAEELLQAPQSRH